MCGSFGGVTGAPAKICPYRSDCSRESCQYGAEKLIDFLRRTIVSRHHDDLAERQNRSEKQFLFVRLKLGRGYRLEPLYTVPQFSPATRAKAQGCFAALASR